MMHHQFDSHQQWLNNCAPKTREDLVVSRQKLAELSKWFHRMFVAKEAKRSRFLLLKGPTGCGKTAAVNILCRDFDVQLIDCQIDGSGNFGTFLDSEEGSVDKWKQGQTDQFKRFVNKLNHCQTSLLVEDRSTTKTPSQNRLIVVEEFPNAFYYKTKDFHNILKKTATRCIPIVFILSQTSNGQSLEYKLFPKQLQEELGMDVINFPAVTDKSLTDRLINVSDGQVNTKDIEEIVLCSSGDIRSAINNLQVRFTHLLSDCKPFSISKHNQRKKQKTLTDNNQVNSLFCPGGRDQSVTLPHAIGKVLHAKRQPVNKLNESSLSEFLQKKERQPLIEVAELLEPKIGISSDSFLEWLHQNYIDFVSDLQQAIECLSTLSQVDSWSRDHWAHRDIGDQYKRIISIRGLMYHLPASNQPNAIKKNTFKPLTKPEKEESRQVKCFKWRCSSSHLKPSVSRFSAKQLIIDVLPSIGTSPFLRKKLKSTHLIDEEILFKEVGIRTEGPPDLADEKVNLIEEDDDDDGRLDGDDYTIEDDSD